MSRILQLISALVVSFLLLASAASAQRVRAITSGGFTVPYLELVPQFERDTGIKVESAFGPSMGEAPSAIPMRLEREEPTDLVIMASTALDDLIAKGTVVVGSRIDLVRSTIGMVVRRGAQAPDISTVEAFIRTLLEATSIAYSGSASGTYLSTELFPRLGIADQIIDKSQRIVGERVANVVARGDAEIGFQQISELLAVDGTHYVGPLPDEVQKVTVFSAGIVVGAENPEAARRLIAFFASAAAVPAITKAGLEPVYRVK